MEKYNGNFYNTWDALNVLCEDMDSDGSAEAVLEDSVSLKDPNSIEAVRNMFFNAINTNNGEVILTADSLADLRTVAARASGKLARTKNWLPTLQYILNGVRVEEAVLAKVNDEPEFRAELEQHIIKKAGGTRRLAQKYAFSNDDTHTNISAAGAADKPDLYAVNSPEEGIIRHIEVKATHSSASAPKNFHKADAVVIYLMKTADWYVRVKLDDVKQGDVKQGDVKQGDVKQGDAVYSAPVLFHSKEKIAGLLSLQPTAARASHYYGESYITAKEASDFESGGQLLEHCDPDEGI